MSAVHFSLCNVDRISDFEETIAKLIAEEDVINSKRIDVKIEVNGMKGKYVIVGNHCRIVLERHHELTAIISDQEPTCSHLKSYLRYSTSL